MPYTVTAADSVHDALALIWLSAADRSAVRRASDAIDKELRNDPFPRSQPFASDRILSTPPLTVIFSVSPDDCKVEILAYFYTP